MKSNIIQVMEPRKDFILINHKETFALRTDRPYLWLQQILIFGLKKLGAYNQVSHEYITYHTIDQKDLLTKLSIMWKAIWEFENQSPVAVYMGKEEFYKLTGNMLSCGLEFNIDGARSFRGMKIVVVPYMSGILPISANYLP